MPYKENKNLEGKVVNTKYKKFLFICFFVFILSSFLYYIFVINLIWLGSQSTSLTWYYKTFLLKTHKAGSIIIDSGSNSYHGIKSSLIEKEFNKTTINVADSVVVPLFAKLARLEKTVKRGDILILPFEYSALIDQDAIEWQFAAGVFFDFSYYFEFLSLKDKIKIISHVPFHTLIKVIKSIKKGYKDENYHKENINILYALANQEKIENDKISDAFLKQAISSKLITYNGDFGIVAKPVPYPPAAAKHCFDNCSICTYSMAYANAKFNRYPIKNFLDKMNKIGVKVIFTYPSVAGKNCYDFTNETLKNSFNNLMSEFKNEIQQQGALFIANSHEESYFDEKYIYDTTYHLDQEGKIIRTLRLIDHLKKIL